MTRSIIDGAIGIGGGGGGGGTVGPAGPQGPPGPPGVSTNLFKYNYSTVLSAPPNTGQVRSNAATAATTTTIWAHRQDANSIDEKVLLLSVVSGDELYVQDAQDSSSYARYRLTAAPVDAGAYVTYAVSLISAGTTPLAGVGILFGAVRAGVPGPKGDKGDPGVAGPPGADSIVPGPPGATGPAGPGVAAGGTTGQILAKTSNADYATGWIAPPSGGGIPPGTLGANNILVADVADVPLGRLVGPSTIVGRAATGAIAALTGAQVSTILGLGTLATKSTIGSADITDGTIVAGDLAVDPYARANHTGTQLASTVSDFNTAVRTNRLDQMATPTASVALGGQTITGLGTPANPTDGATKAYVDSATGSGISANLYDAFTVLRADVDNTPTPLTVGPSTLVGRAATGGIVALDATGTKTLLAITSSDVSGLGTLATKSAITSTDITDGTIATADLADGAVTSLKIADATIVNADIALGAAIDTAKLSVDPLARANHTGTQLAATISDFNAAVRLNRLDQMAKPTATLDLNGQVATGSAAPTLGSDLVNKAYADNMSAGLVVKASVKATSTANVTISSPGTAIDGITLSNGNRVLLKDQTDATQNGIYVFNGSASAMTRATDADTDPELSSGAFTFTESGTANSGKAWVLNNPNPVVIGTTAQQWVQFAGGSSGVVGTANRITVTGTQVDISSAYVGQASLTTLGTITTGVWNGTPIAVANGGTGATTAAGARTNLGISSGKYTTTIGTGAATSFTVTHGLGTKDIVVELYEVATGLTVYADITRTSTTQITIGGFTVAPATSAIAVVVMG